MRNFKKYLAAALVAAMAMPVVLPAMAVAPLEGDKAVKEADFTMENAEKAVAHMKSVVNEVEVPTKLYDKDFEKGKNLFTLANNAFNSIKKAEGTNYKEVLDFYAQFLALETNNEATERIKGEITLEGRNTLNEKIMELKLKANRFATDLDVLVTFGKLDEKELGKVKEILRETKDLMPKLSNVEELENNIQAFAEIVAEAEALGLKVNEEGKIENLASKGVEKDNKEVKEARKLAETGVDFSAIAGVMSLASVAGLGGLAIKRRK